MPAGPAPTIITSYFIGTAPSEPRTTCYRWHIFVGAFGYGQTTTEVPPVIEQRSWKTNRCNLEKSMRNVNF
jgi:hypothetical protein